MVAAAGLGPVGPFEAMLLLFGGILWVVPLWVICGKLGWHPALSLLVFLPLIGLVFGVMTIWEALHDAGYSRWLVLILIVPVANLVFAFWLAFSSWSSQVGTAAASSS